MMIGSNRKRRVLFFPSYRGGGFGHIGRCLALAEELSRRGWEAGFVLGGPHANRVARMGWPIFRPPFPPLPARIWQRLKDLFIPIPPHPAYLFFSDLSFQAIRDGFHTPRRVWEEVRWSLSVVDRFRPHLLVGDAWLLTSIVGRLTGLPVVQIVRAAAHPACPRLIWWRPLPPQIRPPDIGRAFNPALERWGLPPIQQAEDLLEGDLLLVPSIPALDPLPPEVERTHYVGPLVRKTRPPEPTPEWLSRLPRYRPLVYVTVGGGSDAVRGMGLLPLWEAAFAGSGWSVVISTGGRPVPDRPWAGGLRVLPWVPGPAVVARANVVLFHGGYGTMMETVRAGVPSVVLPFHAEQEGNGRRLQQAGAARVLAPKEDDLTPLEGRWGGGTFVTLACSHLPHRPDEVREAVVAVLEENRYAIAAARLRRKQAAYNGVAQAADLVDDLGSF